MKFIFFRFWRTEKMYSVMKGLMGQWPSRIFGLEPPLLPIFWQLATSPDLHLDLGLDVNVIVEFSVYKNPYNNCCQMSFIPLTIHQNRCRLGFAPDLTGGTYNPPPDPLAGFKGPLRGRRGMEGWEGRTRRRRRGEGNGKGDGEGGKREMYSCSKDKIDLCTLCPKKRHWCYTL